MRKWAWKSTGIAAATAFALAALASAPARADAYGLTKVALSGESAPDSGGVFDPNFFSLSLNEAGEVVFPAQLTVGEDFSFGVFARRGAGLEAVALRGDTAPDTGGGTYTYVGGTAVVNDAGDVSFLAYVTGGTTDRGLFVDSGGVQSSVILAGEAADPPVGGTYDPSTADLDRHGLANSGAVAFLSTLSGAAAASGIFLGTAAGETHLVLEGGPTPAGGTYGPFLYPAGSPSGHAAFVAGVVGGPAASGLFQHDGAADSTVALSGDTAPGTNEGTYLEFYYPAVNASGDAVFLASVAGSAVGGGVFADLGGTLWPVAVENDPAPETSGGTITSVPSPAAIDGAGNVVFPAGISGGSVTGAVYRYAAAAQSLSPVVFAGDAAPDTGGATFASFGAVGANDAGEVAFQATLSDGRHGIFLASPAVGPAAVPSFGAAGLAALALLFAGIGSVALHRRAPADARVV
jgi:hypothetical protein